jgi:hypothetical protein
MRRARRSSHGACGPPRPSWSGHSMRSISSWMLPRLPMICNRTGRHDKVPANSGVLQCMRIHESPHAPHALQFRPQAGMHAPHEGCMFYHQCLFYIAIIAAIDGRRTNPLEVRWLQLGHCRSRFRPGRVRKVLAWSLSRMHAREGSHVGPSTMMGVMTKKMLRPDNACHLSIFGNIMHDMMAWKAAD